MPDRTPSSISSTIIKGPDNNWYTAIVYVDAKFQIQFLLMKGDEADSKAEYMRQDPVAIAGKVIGNAHKVALVAYHNQHVDSVTANQIRVYYITQPDNSRGNKRFIREICLSAKDNSFFNATWFEGESNNQTFNRDVTDAVPQHSPLSAKYGGGKIKVFYRKDGEDALSVAYSTQNDSKNKVWFTKTIYSQWPI